MPSAASTGGGLPASKGVPRQDGLPPLLSYSLGLLDGLQGQRLETLEPLCQLPPPRRDGLSRVKGCYPYTTVSPGFSSTTRPPTLTEAISGLLDLNVACLLTLIWAATPTSPEIDVGHTLMGLEKTTTT